MNRLSDIRDTLAAAVASVDGELSRLASERDRLTAAINALTDEQAPPPKTPTPTAPPKRNAGNARRAAARVVCADCGETFSAMGLGPHRRHRHPGVSKPPVAAVPDLPRASYRDLPAKVLRCECGVEERGIPDLTRHTLSAHQREPRPLERTPVRPRDGVA